MAEAKTDFCSTGIAPRKESAPDLILTGLGAAFFLIAFAAFRRVVWAPDSHLALPLGLTALAGLGLQAWGVFRIWRRRDDAALMEAGMLGFIFFTGLSAKLPSGSALAVFAALLPLAPAAVFAWSTVRLARRADELQRRIAQEALAFGFVVSLFAALAGAALEAAGLPRLDWMWMAAILVLSCGAGFLLASRRYR